MGMAVSVPRYTVDDLDRFPNDGNRYELLDGLLLVTPAPSVAHQAIATRLLTRLSNAVEVPGYAQVFGPGAIVAPPGTQLQPDILVCPAGIPLDGKWQDITGHWLAVEVLSRSSRIYDREFKRDAYFALGVAEVWLVDLRDRSLEVCRQRGPGEVVRDTVRWRVPGRELVVALELSEVFAGLS